MGSLYPFASRQSVSQRIVFAGIIITAVAVLVPLGVAFAGTPTTWTVDGKASDKCTVAKPNCTTIQDAIDKSSNGDTIDIDAGTYLSGFSVVGKTNLTIVGNGNGTGNNATIIEPSSLISTGVSHKYAQNMQVSVFVNNSSGITLQDMRIEGNLQTPGAGGPDALLFWNASTGTVQAVDVAGNYVINGAQTGQGIAVDGGTTNLTVKDTDISGFQKNGIDEEDGNCYSPAPNQITCTTSPGSLALSVQGGSITGAGATNLIAQNGIVAWNEGGGTVSATVNGTSISDLRYTGNDNSAAGILAYVGASIPTISNVTFDHTQLYIGSASSGTPIDATNGNVFDGIMPVNATPSQLATIENKVDGEMETNGQDPIFLLPKTWIVTTKNLGVQKGIKDASKGDTVLVTPGTYNGTFSINKSIVFEGGNSGITGTSTSRAAESILDGSSGGSQSVTLTVSANNVTVDGFTIQGGNSTGVDMVSTIKNATIKNNIITNNSIGAYTNCASDCLVQHNEFTGNNIPGASGGAAIYTDQGSNGLTIDQNDFTNQQINSAIIFASDKAGTNNNATVTNNTIENNNSNNSMIYVVDLTGGTFSGNDVSQSGATALKFATADSNITVTGNTFTNSAYGVKVIDGSTDGLPYTAPSSNITITDNNLSNDTTAGVADLGGYSGTTLDAENNWWGDVTGAADIVSGDGSIPDMNSPGLGSTALGAVDYSNWCTDATCTSFTNGTQLATPTLLGWNVQSQASGLESDPISITCTPSGVSVDQSMNSLNQRWSTVNGTDVKYIRRVSTDGGNTWTVLTGSVFTGGSMGAWSNFDPTDQGKTFDTEVEAFEDFNGNNLPDDGPLTVSGWSNDCKITYTGTAPVTALVAPTPVSPANGIVTTTAGLTSVNWTTSSDVFPPITYYYEVSNSSATNPDGSFATPVYSQGGLTTNSIDTAGTSDGTYYWHVYAQDNNSNKSPWSTTQSFTVNNTPTVTTGTATGVNNTDATLNATNGLFAAANTSFWWGTTNAGPFTSGSAPVPPAGWQNDSGLGGAAVGATFDESFTNLTPGTTYYFVAWIDVGGTWYPGTVQSFTTTGVAPTASVTTDAATGIDPTDATLNAQNGALAVDQTSFWWGTTPASSFTAAADPSSEFPASGWSHDSGLGSAAANASFDEPLTGLTASTTYYYAAWVHVGGTWYPGTVLSFSTGGAPPVISNEQISTTPTTATITWTTDHNSTSRVVYGTVSQSSGATNTCNSTPGGVSYDCYGYSNSTDETDTPADTNGVINHSVTVTGLTTGVTYYFRPVSEGSPEAEGSELSGTPSTAPTATQQRIDVTENTTGTITLTGTGPVGDTLTFATTTSPTDGSLSGTLPDLTYTPNAGFTGNDAFNFTVTDTTTNLTSAPATITINVAAAAPAPAPTANDQTLTAGENQSLSITLTDSGSGDTFATTTSPTDGTLTGTPPNLTYTPNAGFTGSDSFTFQSNNSGTPSNVATVSITVVPPPTLVLNGSNPAYVETGSTYSDLGAQIASTSPAIDDNLSIYASVDGGATTSTPTINTSSSGTHSIVYSATDQFGNTGSTTRTVDVLDAPTTALTSTSATTTTISDNPIPVTATFSEAVQNFTTGSIAVSNGGVGNLQMNADNTVATFDVTPAGNGAVTVTVAPGSFDNLAGAPNPDNETISFTYAASTPTPNVTGGGGGGGGGGNGPVFGSFGPSGGLVLGASTTTIPTGSTSTSTNSTSTSTCSALITTIPLGQGLQNPQAQVSALQAFLDSDMNAGVPLTGFFGSKTKVAVEAFQSQYASQILAPWGLTQPTGIVGILTQWKINSLYCPSLDVPEPQVS